MTKTRGIKKYNISKHHFCELSSFCLQYGEWKEELLHRTHSMRGTAAFDMPKGQCKISDPTADLAIRRVELEKSASY